VKGTSLASKVFAALIKVKNVNIGINDNPKCPILEITRMNKQ
jgi:hypothetical protein